jgi:hypothetical protein
VTIFDLLFIAVFFVTFGMLIWAGVAALRGRRVSAVATVRRVVIIASVYLGTVVVVSLVSPRRVLKVGDDQHWDDWWIAVTNVEWCRTKDGSPGISSSAMTKACFTRGRLSGWTRPYHRLAFDNTIDVRSSLGERRR